MKEKKETRAQTFQPYEPISIASIEKFINNISFNNFKEITEERQNELNEIVNAVSMPQYLTMLANISAVSEKLTTSSSRFGLNTDDEKIYFFINKVDPDLKAYNLWQKCVEENADKSVKETKEIYREQSREAFYFNSTFLKNYEEAYYQKFISNSKDYVLMLEDDEEQSKGAR